MREEYVEAVLTLIEQVPPGRVTTYGALAAAVGEAGPRQVGRVLALHGDAVPWWRVVRADGTTADCHGGTAGRLLADEHAPMRAADAVDLTAAMWWPGRS